MADVLLGTVIENLGSFFREELASFLGVGELTQKLCGNLTAIRAILKDAEVKQITSHAVKDWLQKLADAAHVLDDILDECSITSKPCGDNKWITRFHPKKILARRDIGKRMKEVAKKIDVIAEERIKFGLQVGVIEERQRGDDEWRQTTSVITEVVVYGRDKDKEKIVEFLLRHASDSEELSIYPIVGHSGYGKTTLAQLVYNDESVSTHFDLKIWVCVSDDFSMIKILHSIIESATGQNPNLSSLESMQKKVQEVLQSKRYLLVLDDVWNEDHGKWYKFKFLLQSAITRKGSSILVTTRLEIVASIMGTQPRHLLVGLSDDDIWPLFKHCTFGPNGEEHAELATIGKEIVRKCVGSPLAAKVLGSLLRFKREKHQWLSIKESKFWNLSEDNPIMSALRLSYYNLKLPLRPCFSFCAVFPKDFEIHKECLIHLWMANGLLTSRGNLQMELLGNEVWNELYQRSFFQEVKSDIVGNITFKMHDLVHDLAQSIMGEECVASEVSSLADLSIRVHHISFIDSKEKLDYKMIPFNKIESLRTFLEFRPSTKKLDVLPPINLLRALRTSSFGLSALRNLMHLRYLELCHSRITTLPGSVCRLQKLQTLKLKDCPYFSHFPKQLTQLQELRHIVIENCFSLVSTPFRIGELTCLKTLTVFIVGSKTGFGLAELHNLQLGGMLHIRGLENVSNDGDAREANLIGNKDLNRLYLSWGDYTNSQVRDVDVARVLEALEPHSGLKSFGVNGYRGTHFPRWMSNTSILKGLVHIILYGCETCRKLPPFGKLPCLTNLVIVGMRDIKYIDDDMYDPATEKAFASLKKLTLCSLPNLERVLEVDGVEMLHQLLDLDLTDVPKLTLPSLPSIESLSARGGNEELLKSIFYNNCSDDVASSLGGIACNNRYNLKFLFIAYFAKLKELPVELSTLSALESIYIYYCDEMDSLSEHLLKGLSSLRILVVSKCPKFKSLSDSMRHLTCLEILKITNSPQFVFPHNMNSLTSLRQLVVWGCNENILDNIEGIPSLKRLSLDNFPSLTSLPDWLGAMTSLQVLQISRFPMLRSLPDSIQQLQNLQKLSILRSSMLLRKRCKRGVGEDWHKIAHIPALILESDAKTSFCENIISACNTGKQIWYRLQHGYTTTGEFDRLIEEL
ncbi:putative P-loop containing nucleoside triphosphate hydrolase, leucine-rich repeat domain, L [Medicago truncatula]|uniref:Disease resistance protein RGA1 n=1 Tax=Medicago truncatula TaxID=3880 RepID=G7IWB4_MEDTR|nr:putative disease resistance protein RGA1 [Medicago truncatula]AES69165.1 disease resistance protein RGA1 [Medicago truncatula]RHN65989.1 putative P-loop containing nucleoside triphosphate hydrolase, leucine-rich repeat domain, L [Medicago truncatula]